MFYVYIVRCSDNTFYTGYTTDVQRRVATHNRGRGAKYTRGRLPVELVLIESFETKAEALRREIDIKRLTRGAKEQLLAKRRRGV